MAIDTHSTADTGDDRSGVGTKVRAWDLPTRLFHWTLVVLVASAWISFTYSDALGDPTLKWHRYNGYAILILIVWRLLYGFVGPTTVRFDRFVTGPLRAFRFARSFLQKRDPHYLGHNPVAGYAILGLIAILGTQASLGLISEEHNFITWGPLSSLVSAEWRAWATSTHSQLYYYGLLFLVVIHLLGAFVHDVGRREGITKAMVTGTKEPRDFVDAQSLQMSQSQIAIRALACLAVAVAFVFGGIKLGGGTLFY